MKTQLTAAFLLLLITGCQTQAPLTYSKLQSIKPGVTTRENVIEMFGEPNGIGSATFDSPYYLSAGDTRPGRILRGPEIRCETFDYYQRLGAETTDALSIYFTNGIVKSWSKR